MHRISETISRLLAVAIIAFILFFAYIITLDSICTSSKRNHY